MTDAHAGRERVNGIFTKPKRALKGVESIKRWQETLLCYEFEVPWGPALWLGPLGIRLIILLHSSYSELPRKSFCSRWPLISHAHNLSLEYLLHPLSALDLKGNTEQIWSATFLEKVRLKKETEQEKQDRISTNIIKKF